MHHFGGIDNSHLDPGIVEGLIHFLDAHNELVQLFRTTIDKCRELDIPEFKIRLYNAEGARSYELPTSNTLGAMVFESGIADNADFDVIIQHRDSPTQRVNKMYPSYMSLQFPLLFIYGQPGYHTELMLKSANGVGRGKRITMLAYYRYQLHFQLQQYDLLFRGGRLFQQYVVGVFCAIEQNRLDFIRKKQNDIRSDYLSGLRPAIHDVTEDSSFDCLPQRRTYIWKCNWRYDTLHFTLTLGLPHCHTLLWVDSACKVRIAEDVDRFISAELPDPNIDPKGYNVVLEMMMHGPCGAVNLKAACMKGDKCSKKFPKKFNKKTFFDDNGHVHYRRRDTSISATRNKFKLDNSYVIPYNRDLLLAFRAHINVEYYGWSMLIKYLFKCISKDEIQNYVEGRFICAHEAYWRILKLKLVVDLPGKKSTTLTEWFAFNEANEVGRHLSYLEFPSEFVWYSDRKSWSPRKNSKSSIGRLAYVHPTSGELFFLRMLLCHQKGCRDFWEVQTVKGVFYLTYRAACQALGLLGDDKEGEIAFEEECGSATPEELRFLFSHILLYCDVADPSRLWKEMSYDIPKKVSDKVQIADYHLNDDSLQGYTVYEIEIILTNCGKSLHSFSLPPPPQDLLAELANRLLMEERNYNREELAKLKNESIPLLNAEQKQIYDHIINADANNRQALIFVYGHGGTGKTFLWKTIVSSLRCERKIVLAVASSGIASLLLPAGHTDEAPMNDRHCFKALDRSLRDIVDEPSSLLGGKSVLLGGDFLQTLPVKKGASKIEVIASCIYESVLWPSFKVFTLKDNMRLARPDISLEERSLVNSFASWLLDIGDGKIGEPAEEDPENTSWVHIPPAYCLPADEQGLSKLIDFIYDQSTLHTPSATTLQQKAIVCPKNETADIINSKVLDMVPGESTIYISQDEATPTGNDGAKTEMLYPIENLNTFKLPGFPPHQLELKVGAPVMLLRNVNIAGGLCNGTRMIVRQLRMKLIEVQIITGTRVGEKVFIHRIPLIHKDPNLPFFLKRKQFPIKLCYAMTINKS
ncbi:DNA helicase [Tanacetum coccineum]